MTEENKSFNDMDNLEFKFQKLQFLPEDEEKMKTMTTREKIEFIRELKAHQRFTIVPQENE